MQICNSFFLAKVLTLNPSRMLTWVEDGEQNMKQFVKRIFAAISWILATDRLLVKTLTNGEMGKEIWNVGVSHQSAF